MTRREAYAKHQELWNEIARMIDAGVEYRDVTDYKIHALENMGLKITEMPVGFCYACAVSDECTECLVEWTGKSCVDNTESEYFWFQKYIFNTNYKKAKEYAIKIANLKLKKGLPLDEECE